MSDYIPDELLTKILTFLPTKSLVRFTCVCKSWHSLITSSDFITTHLSQTKISNDRENSHLSLLRYCTSDSFKSHFYLHMDNDDFDMYKRLVFPFSNFSMYCRVLGSCNGLICLSDDVFDDIVILWNPSIRKSLTLPDSRFKNQPQHRFVSGFGFDSRTNDYKVVKLVYLCSDDAGAFFSTRVELYKLSTGCWETITATIHPYCAKFNYSCHAFINGSVHWSASKIGRGNLILSFDMSEEVFREILLPVNHFTSEDFYREMHVAVCGEWLSFFHIHISEHNCLVWAMKEYGVEESWTKLYTVDFNGELEMPLGFRSNRELLLAKTNGELVSYDSKTQQIKYLCENSCLVESYFTINVNTYVESLVLLGAANRLGTGLVKQSRKKRNNRRFHRS